MVRISSFLPLKANEEVRAMTLSSGLCERWSINSSDRPSEKYSWSRFSLMSTKGSTAIDFCGASSAAGALGACFGGAERHRCQPMAAAPIDKPSTATGHQGKELRAGSAVGVAGWEGPGRLSV